MRLSFAHVKSAARAFGIAFVVLGLSRFSEAPGLIAGARQACDMPSRTIHEGPGCPQVLWATWYAVAAVSLIAFGSGLVTARRRWVAWSLLAISLMWYLHFLAPYFPAYRFAFARSYLYAAVRFMGTLPPVVTPAVLLLMSDRIWRNQPKLRRVLLTLRNALVKWVLPKWMLRVVGATVVAVTAHRLREVPWRMAAAHDESLWHFLWTIGDALRDAILEATFSISLFVLGVGLLMGRRSALGGALVLVSGLVVFRVLMPSFPDQALGSVNIMSNMLSRTLFNGVHIAISVFLLLTGIGLLRGKAGIWFASDDAGMRGA